MKRSELKEAIKAEIKSVLTEEFQVGDIVMLTRGDDELEVIGFEIVTGKHFLYIL